jgi:hypothetical protein
MFPGLSYLSTIPELVGPNFKVWRNQLDCVLTMLDLDYVLSSPCPQVLKDVVRGVNESEESFQTRSTPTAKVVPLLTLIPHGVLTAHTPPLRPSSAGSMPTSKPCKRALLCRAARGRGPATTSRPRQGWLHSQVWLSILHRKGPSIVVTGDHTTRIGRNRCVRCSALRSWMRKRE